jgi:MtaA/CmuA family methyltransferase
MGKSLLLSALRGEKTERTPWVPFVGCHGGALLGVDAASYLSSADHIAEGTLKAIEVYEPDGIPIFFDLSVEAEALGCSLQWAKENPPAVQSHVLDHKKLLELPKIDERSGRIPLILEALRRVQQAAPDIALYGLITGPFTLALHLKGTNIFMDMYDRPEEVHKLLAFCTQAAKQMADLYIDANCDIISIVDPMTSQISPDTFQTFVSPYAGDFFRHVRQKQKPSSFFVCGHAQKNVEAMCLTGPDNISVDENIPLDYVKKTCQKHKVSFGGNLQLTVVLLLGGEKDVQRNTLECLDIGGDTGFVLAPGCDLPYATPPSHLQAVARLIHDPYYRQVARELVAGYITTNETINLTDYGRSDQIIVDVVTLDSESCAPCQYMVEAVRSVVDLFPGLVLWREHKIKERESVEFMMGLMVKNIPTICIDGTIKFVSIIPSRQELIQAIQDRINEKYSLKMWQHRGRLLVLADDSPASKELIQNVRQAGMELGSTVEIRQITDPKQTAGYQVRSLPAAISVEENIKSEGRVPSVEVIKEWLKDLD